MRASTSGSSCFALDVRSAPSRMPVTLWRSNCSAGWSSSALKRHKCRGKWLYHRFGTCCQKHHAQRSHTHTHNQERYSPQFDAPKILHQEHKEVALSKQQIPPHSTQMHTQLVALLQHTQKSARPHKWEGQGAGKQSRCENKASFLLCACTLVHVHTNGQRVNGTGQRHDSASRRGKSGHSRSGRELVRLVNDIPFLH